LQGSRNSWLRTWERIDADCGIYSLPYAIIHGVRHRIFGMGRGDRSRAHTQYIASPGFFFSFYDVHYVMGNMILKRLARQLAYGICSSLHI
jgi:hypothetical protein